MTWLGGYFRPSSQSTLNTTLTRRSSGQSVSGEELGHTELEVVPTQKNRRVESPRMGMREGQKKGFKQPLYVEWLLVREYRDNVILLQKPEERGF